MTSTNSATAALAATERFSVARLQKVAGLVIAAFFVLHLANHLTVLAGIDSHIKVMETLRPLYRNIFAESILFFCVAVQVISSLFGFWRLRKNEKSWPERMKAFAGLYLAFFLVVHSAAVLFGRYGLGLDTNIYYAIAGYHVPPSQWFFIPYYFLAVFAVFVLIAAAKRGKAAAMVIVSGGGVALLLTLAFMGLFFDIQIPAEYLAVYQ